MQKVNSTPDTTERLALLGKTLYLGAICALIAYLAWQWQTMLWYVLVGLVLMGCARLWPFRAMSEPMELGLDLFAFVLTLAVFIQLCEFLIGQPSTTFLLDTPWVRSVHQQVGAWPLWFTLPCYYLLGDFLTYWAHRLLHGRLLWPTHAFHHSPKHLNWLSGMRSTFIHNIGIFLPYTLVWVFFPAPKAGMIATALAIFEVANQHYLHSNIRLPCQRQLEWLLVTPRFHFVHHSACKQRTDSNYGFIFSIWDRLFGTFVDPDTVDPADPLGLDYEISNWRMIIGLPKPRAQAETP